MKKINSKNNANKLFNGNVHKIRKSKQRKVLMEIQNDMADFYNKFVLDKGKESVQIAL